MRPIAVPLQKRRLGFAQLALLAKIPQQRRRCERGRRVELGSANPFLVKGGSSDRGVRLSSHVPLFTTPIPNFDWRALV